jgi:uncharacterized membrane protein
MNKATSSLQSTIGKGWSIHIYRSDRQLLCSLYPSHGWTFLAGIVLGFVLALVSLQFQKNTTKSTPSVSAPMQAPLSID